VIRGASSDTKAIREMSAPNARQVARLEWKVATVVGIRDETRHARTLILDVPEWSGHLAGQHVDVRLVAEDGYQAQRSYSIASAPGSRYVELTVERIENAEVSPYLTDVLQSGDGLEVRGPIGGYFVWRPEDGGPLLLIGGGSGVVPLMAMLRHHASTAASNASAEVRLLYSARSIDDVIYKEELDAIDSRGVARVTIALTRAWPNEWRGFRRRIDRAMLEEVAWPASAGARVYVCGPTPLVESVATLLVELGYHAARVRTERFGPTG
jgi:ferredoxin-NADP reductase